MISPDWLNGDLVFAPVPHNSIDLPSGCVGIIINNTTIMSVSPSGEVLLINARPDNFAPPAEYPEIPQPRDGVEDWLNG